MRESQYQAEVIKKLKREFPDCMVLKSDSSYLQGIPDLLVLIGNGWAALEVKISDREPFQPNQEYYLERMANMSYAAVISPDNEEYVFDELHRAFGSGR